MLLAAAGEERADLLTVGTHGGSRAAGIVFGSVATAILHEASCAVLVARPSASAEPFPSAIVLGFDGSPTAAEAAALADRLGAQFGVPVRALIATGGKPLTRDHLPARPAMESDDRYPVDALVAASREADLLVVGSRELHGLSALGSVSEQVAHRSACSVLVVRPPAAQGAPGEAVAAAAVR